MTGLRSVAAAAVLLVAPLPLPAQWGGTLRFVTGAEPRTMHPWLASEEASQTATFLTSACLVRIHRVTQKVEPALATGWKWSDGGRTVTFDLRRGVRFSDGTPFSAADVAYTIRGVLDAALASPQASSMRVGGADPVVTVLSPTRVAVRFAAAPAGWERIFGGLAILSAQSPKREQAGLGPFVLAERKPGISLRFVRNPHYWRSGPGGRALPYFYEVEMAIQANREIEFKRFERAEIDFISRVTPDTFERLRALRPAAARNLGASMDPEILWFNLTGKAEPSYKNEWFASRAFRQAVSAAIRREDLARIAFKSLATAAEGPVSPANKAWVNTSIRRARFDLPAAKKLLEKDGFRMTGAARLVDRAGRPVEFSIVTNAGNAARMKMATLIQQDLKALGIEVRIATLDFPSLVERISRTFAYDACLLGQSNIDSDPNGVMNIWLSSAPNNPWHPLQAKPSSAWEAEIDRLMNAQAATADHGQRRKHFDRVQEIARSEEPVIYLVFKNVLAAIGERLANTEPAVLYPHVIWNIDELAAAPGKATARTQVSSLLR